MNALITLKDRYGRYKELTKQFADERHLDNYITYMYGRGWQVVGIEPIK